MINRAWGSFSLNLSKILLQDYSLSLHSLLIPSFSVYDLAGLSGGTLNGHATLRR